MTQRNNQIKRSIELSCPKVEQSYKKHHHHSTAVLNRAGSQIRSNSAAAEELNNSSLTLRLDNELDMINSKEEQSNFESGISHQILTRTAISGGYVAEEML